MAQGFANLPFLPTIAKQIAIIEGPVSFILVLSIWIEVQHCNIVGLVQRLFRVAQI